MYTAWDRNHTNILQEEYIQGKKPDIQNLYKLFVSIVHKIMHESEIL